MERKTARGELSVRKAYSTPILTRYEDIRTVTMGSSPLGQESGPGGVDFRVPGGSANQGSTGQGDTTKDIFE
jgi:hypothetical protein